MNYVYAIMMCLAIGCLGQVELTMTDNADSALSDEIFDQLYDKPGQEIILREEHGVLFERLSLMEVAASKWGLVLAIEIPETRGLKSKSELCTKKQRKANHKMHRLCSHFARVLTYYDQIETKILKQLHRQRKEMNMLLPPTVDLKRTRSRRALLSFVGDLSQTLFGTVSEKSFNKLKGIVARIELKGRRTEQKHQILEQGLQSFQVNLNKRVGLLRESIQEMTKFSQQMYYKLANFTEEYGETLDVVLASIHQVGTLLEASSLIHAENNKRLANLLGFSSDYDKLMRGVESLLGGHLTTDLVKPSELHLALKMITEHLFRHHNGHKLLFPEPKYYYTHRVLGYIFSNRFLYVGIEIPLSANAARFHLYQVEAVPIPVLTAESQNTTLWTQVKNLPKYVAFSLAGNYYIELSEFELSSCPGQKLKICERTLPMQVFCDRFFHISGWYRLYRIGAFRGWIFTSVVPSTMRVLLQSWITLDK